MEVGAVKQAYNNEVILLKKKLNQAKIQIIHKLTRKAKTLTEKKVPEKLKLKFTKKAESAVKEVLIIKKIKARDVAKFIVTHQGQLNEYLNRPAVDHEKACARLLLHKALQDKYRVIRERFSNISIKDLLMSRQERRKLKKEAREKQKNKKEKRSNEAKGKDVNQADGDWDVEDINMDDNQLYSSSNEESSADEEDDKYEEFDNKDNESIKGETVDDIHKSNDLTKDKSKNRLGDDTNIESCESNDEMESDNESEEQNDLEIPEHVSDESDDSDEGERIGKFVKLTPSLPEDNLNLSNKNSILNIAKLKKDKSKNVNEKKHKDNSKNKNLKNKILLKNFNKGKSETLQENKVADPFFITATGENYMSVAEPRPPDEVKEVHKQGNRQYRRAVMFGHVPKAKPWRDDRRPDRNNSRFSKFDTGDSKGNFRSNGFDKHGTEKRFQKSINTSDGDNLKDRRNNNRSKLDDSSIPEKLHPSWEAKKRQSGILPFQGKKIVFDEG